MEITDIFSRNIDVMSGALVFAGTRVPAEALFGNLADGMSLDEFLENFPTVARSQAEAALQLAAREMERQVA